MTLLTDKMTTITTARASDLRKKTIYIIKNEIKLSNNSRTLVEDNYLHKKLNMERELKYKNKINEDLLAAIRLNSTTKDSQMDQN